MSGAATQRAHEPVLERTRASRPHPYAVEEINRALTERIGRPRTVLDVGCGLGLNGEVARGRGAWVTGIEQTEAGAARAADRLHRALVADIESDSSVAALWAGPLNREQFDLILLGDVLEHTREPDKVLERLLPLLTDEGHVIVSLPNVATWPVRLSLLRGRFDYQDSGVLDRTHLRFFTRRSAQALLERAGLEVLNVTHNPMVVRAAKDLVLRATSYADENDPLALGRSAPYQLYQGLIRPWENLLTKTAPDWWAFQHVFVARKPPRPRKLSLTVGMLTMDEEDSVADMISAIRNVAPDAEILCVDSSMRDNTPDIARALGVKVLRQVPPRGHGPAMERLMYEAAAQSDALIYLDCDFTYPVEEIVRIRRLLEDEAVDVVNCSRTNRKPDAMPWPNYLANRSFAAAAHAMHGVPTVDVHSGMRGYRSSVIRAFNFDGDGDALPIDTLLWPAKCGYRVVETPIAYDERVGPSKLRKLAGTVWTGIRLVKTFGTGSRGGRRFVRRR